VIERMLWALEMVWTPTLESRFDIAHCYGLAFRPETEALYRLALRKLLQFKDLGVRDHSTTVQQPSFTHSHAMDLSGLHSSSAAVYSILNALLHCIYPYTSAAIHLNRPHLNHHPHIGTRVVASS